MLSRGVPGRAGHEIVNIPCSFMGYQRLFGRCDKMSTEFYWRTGPDRLVSSNAAITLLRGIARCAEHPLTQEEYFAAGILVRDALGRVGFQKVSVDEFLVLEVMEG